MDLICLERGTVGKLALSDINPAVEENIKKTVKEIKFLSVEVIYLSDGLKNMGDDLFDCIVSNPPHINVMDPTIPN